MTYEYVIAGRHECPGTPVVVTLWWPRGVSNCKWWQQPKSWPAPRGDGGWLRDAHTPLAR